MWEINAWEDLSANESVVWQNLKLTSKEKENILHLCLHPQYIKLHMNQNCMHNFQIYEAYIYARFSLEKMVTRETHHKHEMIFMWGGLSNR